MRPPFPTVLDASAMSAFRACPRKFELEYLHHWKPKDQSIHLHAGGAFAHGIEAARRSFFEGGRNSTEALAIGVRELLRFYGGSFPVPEDSPKSATRMAGALEYYLSEAFPFDLETATPVLLPSGGRGIEFSFLEPLDVPHPDTGEPLLYSGRFDTLVDYAGNVFGEDDKTTSQLGATWPDQWNLRGQFTGYCWGAARAGRPIQGMLVRGVSILKRGYDHAQTVTYRHPWMIDRWYEQTLRDINRMMKMWEEGKFDYNLDESCSAYGGCMFKQVCLSENPDPWLEVGFQRRQWNPVTREETVL